MERWIFFFNFKVDQVFQVAKEQRVGCSMIAWSWMGVNILFNWFAQQQYVFLFLFFKPIYFFNWFAEQEYLDHHHHVEVYCCQHCQNSSSIFQLKLTVLYLKHKQIIKGIHCSHLHSDLPCTSNVPHEKSVAFAVMVMLKDGNNLVMLLLLLLTMQ